MQTQRAVLQNLQLSLSDLVGREYVEAVCEARAFLSGGRVQDYLALAERKIDCFPEAYGQRLDELLDRVGKPAVRGLGTSLPGASTAAFNQASRPHMAPLAAQGFYRIGEDGRVYVITKSEHYHVPLGHDFPGYRLIEVARQLGIPNATHNNTRGYITRRLERELIRVANGLLPGDEAALERTLQSGARHVLNRVLNLETGSLAAEAALKMMLARFYRPEPGSPLPRYAGKTPVFLVVADQEGGPQANYHGTTILAQVLRGMWPELAKRLAGSGVYVVKPVAINDYPHFERTLLACDTGDFKVAGFLHEIILMNYGAIRLTPEYLRQVYALCRQRDVPILVDEIQSCAWSPQLFLFREYGLQPDFVSVGKGLPGGEYPASRLLASAEFDTLSQFGALVTNGQEELASLAYLITLAFVQANADYVAALGDYYEARLRQTAARFPGLVERVEGYRHMSSIFFHTTHQAVALVQLLNQAGYDVSAQTYKAQCPPAMLTKLPLIASYRMVDHFISAIEAGLIRLANAGAGSQAGD